MSKLKDWQFILLVRKNKYEEIENEYGKSFKIVIADYSHYSLGEQIFLPLQLIKLRPNLVHFPHFNVPLFYFGKYIITVHDLIKHQSRGPQTTTRWQPVYWFKYLAYRFLVWRVVGVAQKIIVPSFWTKKELINHFNLSENKITVTYEGIDDKFKVAKWQSGKVKNILEKYHVVKPFVVYTGSLYPHKNISRLLEAIKLLNPSKSLNLQLVIVCARNVFYERFRQQIQKMGAGKQVVLAGFIPDEELAIIYGQAEAFVFPSLIEGFGLPGLEAMAAGLPVVASNSSCLPEIYGDAALYFNPLDCQDMAEKILEAARNPLTRNKLIKNGYRQIVKYSWEKMARETLEVYRESCACI
jgi:glycosyltransferase involved in cell wall biosynthesis